MIFYGISKSVSFPAKKFNKKFNHHAVKEPTLPRDLTWTPRVVYWSSAQCEFGCLRGKNMCIGKKSPVGSDGIRWDPCPCLILGCFFLGFTIWSCILKTKKCTQKLPAPNLLSSHSWEILRTFAKTWCLFGPNCINSLIASTQTASMVFFDLFAFTKNKTDVYLFLGGGAFP